MRFERPFWTIAAIGALLALLSVVFARPLLVVGAALIGAWLLGRQFVFVRELERIRDQLAVDHIVAQNRVQTGESVSVVLSANMPAPTELDVTVESQPPITATGSTREERTAILESGDGETNYTVAFPIAGEHAFPKPTITATDRTGLFSEAFTQGFATEMIVEPRTPQNVHVGVGGTKIAAIYGEHEGGRLGSGVSPSELREYERGDSAHRIDWKATARHGEPYVREYEAETDRKTTLVFDHRNATGQGPTGRTKLDYLREAALIFTNTSRDVTDPLGLYAIGDEGVTQQLRPRTTGDQYRAIRRTLRELTPTEEQTTTEIASPAAARQAAKQLQNDETPFAGTLRPFFEDTDPYITKVEANPLVETVQTHLDRLHGTVWTVIFTDDTDRVGVREAVKLARRGDAHVSVFLTPSVLFEPGGLGDIETAYDRYLSFEEFRRELTRLDRVSAFEVGPGDRIATLLDARRQRRSAYQ